MSDVKRYKAAGSGVVRTDPKGDLVLYIDYARLKAEVERLTEAGDWMMADLIPYQQFDGFKSVKDWNAAKGVQS